MTHHSNQLLTLKQVQRRTRKSRTTIMRWRTKGIPPKRGAKRLKLEQIQIGGNDVRVRRVDLLKFLKALNPKTPMDILKQIVYSD